MLAGDLAHLPLSFAGTVLVHPYLVDLALALDRLDQLDQLMRAVAFRCPSARVGIHSNSGLAAANAVAALDSRIDVLSTLVSPSGGLIKRIFDDYVGFAKTDKI